MNASTFKALHRTRVKPVRKQHVKGVMNKEEEAYAAHLEDLLYAKTILAYDFESWTFTLVHNTPGGKNGMTYTPDFCVVTEQGFAFYDVKAWWKEKKDVTGRVVRRGKPHYTDDALTKIKMAAEKFPFVRFFGVWRKDKNSPWEREEF